MALANSGSGSDRHERFRLMLDEHRGHGPSEAPANDPHAECHDTTKCGNEPRESAIFQ